MPTQNQEHTPWDDAFKQLMRDTLSELGLQVIEDPKLGKLPLKADLVLISTQSKEGEWQQHPLWQHLTDQALVEFKSVADPLLPGDFEVLLAYTLLYRVKFKIGYQTKLSSWLVIPALNKHLKSALKNYHIHLTEILPGFWRAQTLFPLYVVAYNQLPFEMPYQTLKLFIKSGKSVQDVFRDVLESEHRKTWLKAVHTAMQLVHPKDFREVVEQMSLTSERQALQKTLKELLKEDIEKDLTEREQTVLKKTAQQMRADGMSFAAISKYTGLSEDEISKL